MAASYDFGLKMPALVLVIIRCVGNKDWVGWLVWLEEWFEEKKESFKEEEEEEDYVEPRLNAEDNAWLGIAASGSSFLLTAET